MNKIQLFSIITLAIIVIVILFPKHLCAPKQWQCERYKSTKNTIKNITIAIKHFQSDKGYLPKNLDVLTESSEKARVKYIEKVPLDQWANPFIYVIKESRMEFFIYSVGIDGKDEFGKGDDIILENEYSKIKYCN